MDDRRRQPRSSGHALATTQRPPPRRPSDSHPPAAVRVLRASPSRPSSAPLSCRVSNNFSSGAGAKNKRAADERQSAATTSGPDRRRVTDALHADVVAYTTSVQSTVKQLAVPIEATIAHVRASVVALWPQATVETFGSYATGLWLPNSDVDLVVIVRPASDCSQSPDATRTPADQLRDLAALLQTQPWVASLVVLDTAKVPVLKLLSAHTAVPFDITFESAATHSGLLARDLIRRYTAKMPELYPLAIVFKQLLRERDLNDAYTGGLSSYSLVLMLIHFSQLWRNGDACFQAAAVYASGAMPPRPSTRAGTTNQTMTTGRIQTDVAPVDGSAADNATSHGADASTSAAQRPTLRPACTTMTAPTESTAVTSPAPVSSYATVVARPMQQTPDGASQEVSVKRRFSYAAVAAGIVNVSENKPAAGPPCSYAAALTAPAGSSSTAAANGKTVVTATKQVQDTRLLDAMSVSSSSADTEDSSSSCSHSSLLDSDDESAKVLSPLPPASLGEHIMTILEFFGMIFDYSKNGMSVRDGGYIYRLADSHRSQVGKPALVIEDPIHPDRNVSASSFAFFKVVALFEDSFYAVKYYRASKFTPSALSCLLATAGRTNTSSSDAGS